MGEAGARQARPRPGEHGHRAIDADDVRASPGNGEGDPSGPAPELENGAALRRGEPLPERDIAARDRSRVLPVVEGRVVIPAVPAFRGSGLGSRGPGLGNESALIAPTDSLTNSGAYFAGLAASTSALNGVIVPCSGMTRSTRNFSRWTFSSKLAA